MKVHVRAKLVKITGWSRDKSKAEGDFVDCTGFAQQVRERLEDCTFKPPGLPFEYDFDVSPVEIYRSLENEVKDRLLDEYITEFMNADYVIPTDCEFEYEMLEERE